MTTFEVEQLRRQRRSYMKSIVGLEAVSELSPSQLNTLDRYREQVSRIEATLAENGEPADD